MAPAPLLCSGDGPRPRWPVCLPIVAYCFVALCLAGSSSARRIGSTVSGIEDNIETRCSFFYGRSPAAAKADDHFKPSRAIVRGQIPASGI